MKCINEGIGRILGGQAVGHEEPIELTFRHGFPIRDDLRELSTNDIVRLLTYAGLEEAGSRESFRKLAATMLSTEQLFEESFEVDTIIYGSRSDDIIWLSICVLWERWAPDIPSFDLLNDSMQLGYDLLEKDNKAGLEEWEQTWQMFKTLALKGNFDTIDAFDKASGGLQHVSNWMHDYSDALSCRIDTVSTRQEKRIIFLRDALSSSVKIDGHSRKNFTGDLAQELIDSGNIEEGDQLFEDAISSDPTYVWNYIWWSDAYGLFASKENKNYDKALAIIKRGLAADIKEDRNDLDDRLESLLEISGSKIDHSCADGESPK